MKATIEYSWVSQDIVVSTVSLNWLSTCGEIVRGKCIAITETFTGRFAYSDAEEWASEVAKTVEEMFKQL